MLITVRRPALAPNFVGRKGTRARQVSIACPGPGLPPSLTFRRRVVSRYPSLGTARLTLAKRGHRCEVLRPWHHSVAKPDTRFLSRLQAAANVRQWISTGTTDLAVRGLNRFDKDK
ncbi:hypothetical protein Bbelb_161380 [Branchiostoma belcheri]|nr:hypothetical protein Bbelb_161380 [Branchiostoma belcheri]